MDQWGLLLLLSNVLYWSVFVWVVRRRLWSRTGLAVGLFHMLLATPLVLGPLRAATFDPRFNYQIGFIHAQGAVAFVPSVTVLMWALASAWISVANARGRWMLFPAVGDLLMALNLVAFILSQRAEQVRIKIQGGDFVTITGALLVTGIIVMCIAMPLVATSVWAFRRSGRNPASGSLPPALIQEDRGRDSGASPTNPHSFSYSIHPPPATVSAS